MFEKRNAWSKRLAYPVLIALDKADADLLSGEFVGRVDPMSYFIPENAAALLLCSDERLNNVDLKTLFADKIQDNPIFPIRIPGSVAGQDSAKLINLLHELGFSKIAATAHADCGAANYDMNQKDIIDEVDQYAKDLITDLEKLNVENWGFINSKDEPGLDHFHPASCLLIDGTGRFNDNSDGVLPREKFILNRKIYDDPELAVSHIKFLAGIALGHHGIGIEDENQNFGFSPEHSFYIFVTAYNDEELRQYMEEAKKAIEPSQKNLVKIIGFLAPKAG